MVYDKHVVEVYVIYLSATSRLVRHRHRYRSTHDRTDRLDT